MLYLIEFRFPEQKNPMWAWQLGDEPFGLTFNRANAARFNEKQAAENTLKNAWGEGSETASYGYVVEDSAAKREP